MSRWPAAPSWMSRGRADRLQAILEELAADRKEAA